MGKRDSAGKVYFSNAERFADLVNGFCFGGKQVLRPEDLSEWDSHTGNRTRDVVWKTAFGTGFAVIGEENQETTDYSLPFRIMESEAADYRHQVSTICRRNRNLLRDKDPSVSELEPGERLYRYRKTDRIYPVITIVLSNSDDWKGPRKLSEMMDLDSIPKELLPLINDYRVFVIELSKLNKKDTSVFKTDLKLVLDAIRCSRDGNKLERLLKDNEAYSHMEADAFDLVNAYADLKKYGINRALNEGGKIDMGNIAMEQIIEKYTKKGEERGEKRGEKRGLDKGIIVFIEDKLDDGVDKEIIKDRLIKRFQLEPKKADQYLKKYAVK